MDKEEGAMFNSAMFESNPMDMGFECPTESHGEMGSPPDGWTWAGHREDVHLPHELWVRVFQYLNPVWDGIPVLALVCRSFRDILRQAGVLWRHIHVDPSFYGYHHFTTLMQICRQYGPHIQAITWKNNSTVYEPVFQHLCGLTSLRSLKLPILWSRRIIDNLRELSMLEDIDIHGGYSLRDEDLLQIAVQFPRLRSVSLHACWGLSAAAVKRFVTLLPNLSKLKLKVNSNLVLNDFRSEVAMQEGLGTVREIASSPWACTVSVLCLHFVPVESHELITIVERLHKLRKLSVSNCENLLAVQIESRSLQKVYLFNLWNARYVSINAPLLRMLTIDHGLDSMEGVTIKAPRLRKVIIDGANVLRTLSIESQRLTVADLFRCQNLDMRSLKQTLSDNNSLLCLRLGRLSEENLTLDENCCPSLQELCLLSDFSCNALHIRSPTLRLIHTQSEVDLLALNHLYLVGDHLCKVSLVGVPSLRSMVIQCVSVDAIELNLCSDDQICLEAFVIHAMSSIGFIRLFDCKVNLLSVTTPLARTIVLYRCHMTDYVLQMALTGCSNIAHLNLEKCSLVTQVNIEGQIMEYLNLFGCRDLLLVDIHCPKLIGLNLGHNPKVKLLLNDKERDLTKKCTDIDIVLPKESVRWSHDFPPESYENR